MRRALVLVLATAVVVPACNPDPPRARDAGQTDTGFCCRRPDASTSFDAGFDTFAWSDTGPPGTPVLPPQSWMVTLFLGTDLDLTINLDARAESGLVRAVAGSDGRAGNVIFEVLRDGVLRPREMIVLGIPGVHTCSYDTIALEDLRLQFSDVDGDGVHETLTGVSLLGQVTRSGGGMPPQISDEMFGTSDIRRDETPPTIALAMPEFLPGAEPLVVVASEPIAPDFMPMLVGPRNVVLAPDSGASATARWTADTSDLPPGHYDLVLTTPQDLSGHTPVLVPAIGFDVAALGLPAVDDFGPTVRGVFSSTPIVIVGDDPGEMPTSGATSLLLGSHAALALEVASPGDRTVLLSVRVAGPGATASSGLVITDAHGVWVAQQLVSSYLFASTGTPGFPADEQVAQSLRVDFHAAHAGRYFLVFDVAGTVDPACSGITIASSGTYGIVVDDVSVF